MRFKSRVLVRRVDDRTLDQYIDRLVRPSTVGPPNRSQRCGTARWCRGPRASKWLGFARDRSHDGSILRPQPLRSSRWLAKRLQQERVECVGVSSSQRLRMAEFRLRGLAPVRGRPRTAIGLPVTSSRVRTVRFRPARWHRIPQTGRALLAILPGCGPPTLSLMLYLAVSLPPSRLSVPDCCRLFGFGWACRTSLIARSSIR